ncbi:MAG TPA: hypothetical protein VEZ70_03720 [Allosphingosinicella sp.]|jgi:hypothetical protein|nr:hypothetical protein [Allosphingosinicella sp.]
MTMYVYSTAGEPRGFLFETTIFGLDGTPLGRILGCRVHRFDGSYAGEWFHEMVVDRPSARPRSIPPIAVPPARAAASSAGWRRGVAEYSQYSDAFDRLLDRGLKQAAE